MMQKCYFLDLLGVLCVCEGVYLPDNQTYICQKWLEEDNVWTILNYFSPLIHVKLCYWQYRKKKTIIVENYKNIN